MVELLIGLVIAVIVFYIIREVVGMLGFDANITRIIYLVVGLIFLLWLLNFFGVFSLPIR